jgi:peptidoglycan/LPS O-acetylase OafA/YrhL
MIRRDIQLYRALAVIAVIIYHFNEALLPFGYLGVDLFFVISGFLITKQLLELSNKKKLKLSVFYFKRFKRILPSLATSTIFTLTIGFYNLSIEHFYELLRGIKYSYLFVGNIFFSQTMDYFTIDSKRNLIINLWSLSVEEQFYILFPLIIIIGGKLFKSKYQYKFFLILFLLSLFGLSEAIYTKLSLSKIFFSFDNYLFYSPFSRAFQFLTGSLAASITSRKILRFSKYNRFFLVALLPTLYFELLSFNQILITLLAFFLMINQFELSDRKINTVFVHIGNISFSLYLFHQPILAGIRNHIFYANVNSESFISLKNIPFVISVLFLIYLISLINYLLIEQTYRKVSLFSFSSFKFILISSVIILSFTIYPKNLVSFFNKTTFNIEAVDQTYRTKPGTNYLINKNNQMCIDQDSITSACRFGTGKKHIYILGDSSISSLVSGFLDTETLKDFTIYEYTKSGCYPVINICSFKPNTTFYTDALSISDSIILMGGVFKDEFGNVEEQNLKETTNLLISNNNKVILLGYMPSPKFDELMYYKKTSSLIVSKNSLHFQNEYQSYLKFDNFINDSELLNDPNFHYVEIFNAFCRTNTCDYTENGNYFFIDGVHLSHYGAKAIVDRTNLKNLLLNN